MQHIIQFFKQAFCGHDFNTQEGYCEDNRGIAWNRKGIKVSMYCKKCAYNKSFWKF